MNSGAVAFNDEKRTVVEGMALKVPDEWEAGWHSNASKYSSADPVEEKEEEVRARYLNALTCSTDGEGSTPIIPSASVWTLTIYAVHLCHLGPISHHSQSISGLEGRLVVSLDSCSRLHRSRSLIQRS